MGSRSTILIAAGLAFVLSACKEDRRKVERMEYRALKDQLSRISRTETVDLDKEIERLEGIEISTARIASCRDTCLEAYRAILEASASSKKAQEIISALEGETDPETMEKDQEKALLLLADSESSLGRAREIKDRCYDLLDDLEGEGLDRNR